ncbi:MAG: FAD-dependent monooxygenase [Bauldia sp.]|nr:FAD-dependent monooxygenase [Bauldia sp.]
MTMKGTRVGIIGGSISGCAAAIALSRAGCDVAVFERSSTGLMDRGSGIVIPTPLRDALVAADYLPNDYPICPFGPRRWVYPDGTTDGRLLWRQPTTGTTNNWGTLWRALRARVPDGAYHDGKVLASFDPRADGVRARFVDGSEADFDLLVGADGYHSLVRHRLHPTHEPAFAGYVLWRGNYREAELEDRSTIEELDPDHAWLTVPYDGGHGLVYMIPDFGGETAPGQRRVNWAVYTPLPAALRLDGVGSIPPGAVTPAIYKTLADLLAARFPAAVARLISHSPPDTVSIQPIFDSVVDTYIAERVLLIGDAGTITRPHTASGATKALEEALCLEKLACDGLDLDALLAAYDAERCGVARTLSEVGRRIGRAQVQQTPNWPAMGTADFEDWMKAILANDTLYLYGEDKGAA